MVKAKTVNNEIQTSLTELKASRTEKETQLIDLVSNMYDNVKEAGEYGVEKVDKTLEQICASVRTHPWRYIGGAGAVGFVLGFFMKRHNRE